MIAGMIAARGTLFLLVSACGFVLAGALQSTFRTETHLVQINVVVHDKTGPVANLTKNDFSLTDRGKPRPISVFSMTSTRETTAELLPAHTFSNLVGAPPSVTVILLDRLNTFASTASQPYEDNPQWSEDLAFANARQHLIRFLATLQPKDRVAIYSLGRTVEVLSDFSNDRARLQSILENYRASSLTNREDTDPLAVHTPAPGDFNAKVDRDRLQQAAMNNNMRAQTTLAALSAIAAHVASVPGRKNLVWLTADLSISAAAAAQIVSRAGVAIYTVDARGLLPQNPSTQLESAGDIVFGRIAGSRPQGSVPPGANTMEDLALTTGGRAFVNTNDLAGAIRSAVEDAAVTYTLGFYLDEASLDGKFHEIKVRVKKANYEVRSPHGYFASANERAEGGRLMDVVVTPLESSAIGVSAHVDRSAPDALTITGVIDLAGLELAQQPNLHTGAATVYVVQQDMSGAVLDRSRQRYDLRLTDELYTNYSKSGIIFRDTIKPQSGLATLRILVTGSGARVGSLIIPAAQLP